MPSMILNPRLLWIAQQVRPHVFFADIGSDHAYLPMYLVQNGTLTHAIASDVAAGAVSQGQALVAAAGLSAQIQVVLGNGLEHIVLPAVADIAICGMGGEAIVAIVAAKPELKQGNVRLLLQAMTDTAHLRHFLAAQGFAIEKEDCVASDGRIYQCMVAVFTGVVDRLSAVEAELGRRNLQQRSAVFLAHVAKRQQLVQQWLQAKQQAGEDASAEHALLAMYAEVLSPPEA